MAGGDIAPALAEQVRDAAERRRPLKLSGLDSKSFYGHTVEGEPLQLSAHSGITRYEPTELVLSARGGTPVPEIESALAENGQMLTFEPPGFGHTASIGGAIASGLGGPRRPWGGAPRDQMLGMTLLDGRGRLLHFGGEVMKNVAGYDLSRLMAGALGTLGALLEVSIKVLPAPTAER
ncbi:MAG: FAD-binding protein, partial [Gammaproteobacteria bacterium]|nr:FAD-binding protein [Gammaproteobacteria bacterium]